MTNTVDEVSENIRLQKCPLIKVDVLFKPATQGRDGAEDMNDKIVSISAPYLAWARLD